MLDVALTPTDSGFVPPRDTIIAYKLFRLDKRYPGQLFPLFVNADRPVNMGVWYEAEVGERAGEKVKSKLGPLAFRPGWHGGDSPMATHIGDLSPKQRAARAKIDQLRKVEFEKQLASTDITPDMGREKFLKDLKKRINAQLPYPKNVTKPSLRPSNQIWAEVEFPSDVDWQQEANRRGMGKSGKFSHKYAHITDQIPRGGHYRYKTNPQMTGNWIIGGAMRVNRVLSDAEVDRINQLMGTKDLPRVTPLDIAKHGFK